MMKNFALLAIGVCMFSAIHRLCRERELEAAVCEGLGRVLRPGVLSYNPTSGTQTGYHQYDAQLEDYSRKSIDAEIAALKSFEKRIEAIHPDAAQRRILFRGATGRLCWQTFARSC
jgi:hypothetical protein